MRTSRAGPVFPVPARTNAVRNLRVPQPRRQQRTVLRLPARRPVRRTAATTSSTRSLFAGPTRPASLRPVGFTAYGGAGNDLIIGSQAGDHLAGGSGDDKILGLRGATTSTATPASTSNIITRGSTVDHRRHRAGRATRPAQFKDRDDLVAGRDLLYGEGPGSAAVAATTTRSRHDDDIIFGDHGIVNQDVRAHRHDEGRPAQPAEDPDDAAPRRLRHHRHRRRSSRSATPERRRRHHLRQPRPRRPRRRRRQRHDRRRRAGRHDLRRQRQPFRPRRSATYTSRRFQTLMRHAALQPHRPDRLRRRRQRRQRAASCSSTASPRDYRDTRTTRRGGPSTTSPNLYPRLRRPTRRHARWARQLRQRLPRRQPGQRPDLRPARQRHHPGRRRRSTASRTACATTARSTPVYASRSRPRHGCTGPPARPRLRLRRRPRRRPVVRGATDGEDYIEGNGGNDIVFGGLGQDDILGGSSDFFSLNAANGPTRPRRRRPASDGSDLHLRRRRQPRSAATRRRRTSATAADIDHARDADTIVGDNGRHHPDRRHQRRRRLGAATVSAVRDVQLRQLRHDARLRPEHEARRPRRHAARLHAGRPRLPARPFFAPARRARLCNDAGDAAVGNCSTPLRRAPARRQQRTSTSAATTRSTARPATTPSTAASATTSSTATRRTTT